MKTNKNPPNPGIKMSNIIQWNCNGVFSHLAKLQQLIANQNPTFICLQETRLRANQNFNIRGYDIGRKDRKTLQIASGGVAILTKNSNYGKEIKLQTNLEAVAIKTYIPEPITICTIHLRPNQNVEIEALHNYRRPKCP